MATDVETAASVLGIGRTTAYTLARSGEFPAPVIRVGRRYVVSVEGLLTVLGAIREADQPEVVSDSRR
ncbi:helix-turn-helix domain-containing protein [Actinoplanes sp. NPDC048988]|uniref:helix-turn-helix domain-containing protein n=1 Tax=Actinoplanes sp. NPDC048988 TaxID=3363901 RepID=UPI003712004D